MKNNGNSQSHFHGEEIIIADMEAADSVAKAVRDELDRIAEEKRKTHKKKMLAIIAATGTCIGSAIAAGMVLLIKYFDNSL